MKFRNFIICLLFIFILVSTLSLGQETAIEWNDKGLTLYNEGNYKEAIKCFDEAILLDPCLATIHNNKGLALYKDGKYQDALNCFEESVKLDPAYVNGWYNKGSVLIKLAWYEEAIDCFNKVKELDPENTKADKKIEEANSAMKAAGIEKNPEELVERGVAYFNEKDYENAIICFEEALKIDPENTEALKKKEEALLLQNGTEKKPEEVYFEDCLDLYTQGKTEEAIIKLDMALDANSDYIPALFIKALILASEPDTKEEARVYITKILEIDPELKEIDVNYTYIKGLPPLHIAIMANSLNIARLLIEKGADPNIKTEDGTSPLHVAIAKGNLEIVKLLIEYGADVNSRKDDGVTPLHSAAWFGQIDIAKLLIDHGADVNAQNEDGNTLLHTAVFKDKKEMVELILINGADLNIKNIWGMTPMDIAKNQEIIELLKKYE